MLHITSETKKSFKRAGKKTNTTSSERPSDMLTIQRKLYEQERRHNYKTKKVTKLVTLVTLNFILCWLPAHLFLLFRMILDINTITSTMLLLKLLAHTLTYMTPVINPILYGFYNDNFRQPLLRCLCSRREMPRHKRARTAARRDDGDCASSYSGARSATNPALTQTQSTH
jgi:hypothetical protein